MVVGVKGSRKLEAAKRRVLRAAVNHQLVRFYYGNSYSDAIPAGVMGGGGKVDPELLRQMVEAGWLLEPPKVHLLDGHDWLWEITDDGLAAWDPAYAASRELKRKEAKTMKKFTGQEVLQVLDEIVAEYGEDFVYDRIDGVCYYMQADGPSCIIGHLLHRLGFNLATSLEECDANMKAKPHNPANAKRISVLLGHAPFAGRFTTLAMNIMRTVQGAQDTKVPWGKAVLLARDIYAVQLTFEADEE